LVQAEFFKHTEEEQMEEMQLSDQFLLMEAAVEAVDTVLANLVAQVGALEISAVLQAGQVIVLQKAHLKVILVEQDREVLARLQAAEAEQLLQAEDMQQDPQEELEQLVQ
jgi:hypothetical protein